MRNHVRYASAALAAATTCLNLLTAAPAQAGPGYALSFNGTNTHVAINRPVADDFTIEFWLNSTQVAGANAQWWQGMGLVDGEVNGAYADFGVALGAGTVVFGTGGAGDVSIQSPPVADGKWHHVAATRVRTSGLMALYVDGALVASGTGSKVALNTPTQLRFGCLASGVNYYRGLLDEVRIWSVARSQAQIQGGMSHAPNVDDTSLAGYWPFREGPGGSQTADVSNHGNGGRLVNRPLWVLSSAGWIPGVRLLGVNPVTNECHAVYVDAGVVDAGAPAAIACGNYSSFALKGDGTAMGWGENGSGQTAIPAALTNLVAIDGGNVHTIALSADGTVACWGGNPNGQTNVPATLTSIMAISAGLRHSLALKADGTVIGWGDNGAGQSAVPAAAANAVAVAGGGFHSLALRGDGTVVSWGLNDVGQCNVPPAATNIVAISAGYNHSLALRGDGRVLVWGNNDSGQLNIPAGVTNIVAISAGAAHSLALRGDGSLLAWGNNDIGQTNVPTAATNVVSMSAGGYHNLALRGDGTVLGWGWSSVGQLDMPSSLSQSAFTGSTTGVVDTNTPGIYQISYTRTNMDRSVTGTNRIVVVADRTPPVLTLLGESVSYVTNANRIFADPGCTAWDVCGGNLAVATNGTVNVNFPGAYKITYRATDSSGNTATAIRTVCVALPPAMAGDVNGDGVVDGAEFTAALAKLHGNGRVAEADLRLVLSNYWPVSPWLQMTNTAGAGRTNIVFSLTNDTTVAYAVEVSTNLANWQVLGTATPRYEAGITNGTGQPTRYYRLRRP